MKIEININECLKVRILIRPELNNKIQHIEIYSKEFSVDNFKDKPNTILLYNEFKEIAERMNFYAE